MSRMLLGLSPWGAEGGCTVLAVVQLVWEEGRGSEPQAKTEQGPDLSL